MTRPPGCSMRWLPGRCTPSIDHATSWISRSPNPLAATLDHISMKLRLRHNGALACCSPGRISLVPMDQKCNKPHWST